MYMSATAVFVTLSVVFVGVLVLDLLVVWIARLIVLRPSFQMWRSSLRNWRFLAILLALVPVMQLAIATPSFERFLYENIGWGTSQPAWFTLYKNSLAVQTGLYALFFLASPLAAIWLSLQPTDSEQWPLRTTWLGACALSAIPFAFISLHFLASL